MKSEKCMNCDANLIKLSNNDTKNCQIRTKTLLQLANVHFFIVILHIKE